MKEAPREIFRWAPHTAGITLVKAKDYDLSGEVEAATPYSAWKALREDGQALRPGDLLEIATDPGSQGELRIAKYVGFESAEWLLPKQEPESCPRPRD